MSNLISDILSPKPVRMKVGLYFGSYNPIHIGHLAIANYIVEFTLISTSFGLWFRRKTRTK
jgi:nicotinate-nucleotide adenylyltransferase